MYLKCSFVHRLEFGCDSSILDSSSIKMVITFWMMWDKNTFSADYIRLKMGTGKKGTGENTAVARSIKNTK